MRLFIGGMRGSRPCTGRAYEQFGGDTTSLLIIGAQDERIVLDAGTGLLAVAGQLSKMEPGEVTILFSHYHLDHLAGLMMNPLFHDSKWSFTLVGPTFAEWGIRESVTHLLAQPYWPISFDRMNAHIEFSEFVDEIQVGKLSVRGCAVPHPGGCMAYRLDSINDNKSLVFATDIEWQGRSAINEKAFMKLCTAPRAADILIIDAHFTKDNAEQFAGWGHTSWEDAVEIATTAKIKRLLLGHLDPLADDEALNAREIQVKKKMPGCEFARAGKWFEI